MTKISAYQFRRMMEQKKQQRGASNKYHARRTADGHASGKEGRRARQLHLMEQAGEISQLREQVKYELIPAQRDANGVLLERSASYVADFVYRDKAGHEVVEDTKGVPTPLYVLKRKLMLWLKNIRIREI